MADRKPDPVSLDAIHYETVKKEEALLQIKEEFNLNSSNCKKASVSLKPTSFNPFEINLDASKFEESTLALISEQTPHEKFEAPMTCNMEYGWFESIRAKEKWRHPRQKCTETKFAEDFVAVAKRSPFASKDAISKIPTKSS